MIEPLRAPFPWFGGKRRCAHIVWRAMGNVPNYVEPFYGSGAVLLARPHESKIETELYGRNGGRGVHRPSLKRPNARTGGQGVHSTPGHIIQQLPSLQGRGRGVATADDSVDVDAAPCIEWFRALQTRLRRVRVCCGDWKRVLTDSVIGTTRTRNSGMNPCGVFLDPPYSDAERARDLYGVDDGAISAAVAEWARKHGGDKDLRIVLAGYDGEHAMPDDWRCYHWKSTRGYAAEDNANRERERLWLSPGCLSIEDAQGSLFTESA